MHRRLLLPIVLLLLAVTSLAACGDDDDEPAATDTTEAPASEAEDAAGRAGSLTISGFAFSPDPLEVAAGTAVTVTNEDATGHTWTADDGSVDSGSLGQGDTFEHTFAEAGEVTFHCEIHPSMTGTVIVS